jgi:hypothetical protein
MTSLMLAANAWVDKPVTAKMKAEDIKQVIFLLFSMLRLNGFKKFVDEMIRQNTLSSTVLSVNRYGIKHDI